MKELEFKGGDKYSDVFATGGGRIKHDNEEKKLLVYGYSQSKTL